ncbi:MAG: MGMT family protein [Candidatus Nitrosocaldaceae archaeon]
MNKKRVYEIVKKIPEGRVTTYKAIAKAIGKPNASRAIGKILKDNPNPIVVPCHRVVKSNGMIGGYVYGKEIKQRLLECEGIVIDDGFIKNFNQIFINL